MKKIIITMMLVMGIAFTANAKSIIRQESINNEYNNTVSITGYDGSEKIYRNVKIIQYSKNYWIEFETENGEVFKYNTNEKTSIAIKYVKNQNE